MAKFVAKFILKFIANYSLQKSWEIANFADKKFQFSLVICDENKFAATIRVTLYYTSISKCDPR